MTTPLPLSDQPPIALPSSSPSPPSTTSPTPSPPPTPTSPHPTTSSEPVFVYHVKPPTYRSSRADFQLDKPREHTNKNTNMNYNGTRSQSKNPIPPAVINFVLSTALGVGSMALTTFANHHLCKGLSSLERFVAGVFDRKVRLVIDSVESSHLYESAIVYLGTKASPTPLRLEISALSTVKGVMEIPDFHDGVHYIWRLESTAKSEVKSMELRFDKGRQSQALNRYIPHVIEEAERAKEARRSSIKLYTVGERREWSGLSLKHPSTFETIAMEPKEKVRIIEDLERFVRRKEYYQRVGKAWKRGYLLYGPPGTGKSSLIAAMAKYLRFNVYDLDLGAINSNSDLRSMLQATENRSILVVEDIDCSLRMRNRLGDSSLPMSELSRPEKKVTLSAFMNLIDGLWSSGEDERIIIFTTNYKNKLDPALLRPGRMDVHIPMSYCTQSTFMMLVRNYLGVESHKLFKETAKLIEQVQVTPAEVAEQLMKEDDPQVALEGVVGFLQEKKVQNDVQEEEDADEV